MPKSNLVPNAIVLAGVLLAVALTGCQTGCPFCRSPHGPPEGFTAHAAFYFPRLYYLRGLAAEKSGKPREASEAYHLFLQLSGPDPLAWGEEAKAK